MKIGVMKPCVHTQTLPQSLRQSGQALVELLVAMLSMTTLALAVVWLGRLQDAALQAEHDAHHLAFLAARGETSWTGPDSALAPTLVRLAPLPYAAQPAGEHMYAATLRREWEVADEGALQAIVQLPAYPAVKRQAVTLTNAGHASGDVHTLQRLANAGLSWAQVAAISYDVAQQVTDIMLPVDQPWGRAVPDEQWLTRWQGQIPPWHVQTQEDLP